MAFEHRMYLALIAPAVLVIAGGYALLSRFFSKGEAGLARAKKAGVCLLFLWVVLLGAATYARNLDYRSQTAIWTDTVEKRPGNLRAKVNLAVALIGSDRIPEAKVLLEKTLQNGSRSDALGHALQDLEKTVEALYQYEAANALAARGKTEEAMAGYRIAMDLWPGFAEACVNLANLTAGKGDLPGAVSLYLRALSQKPGFAAAHYNLANALAEQGKWEEAEAHFRRAVSLNPDLAVGYANLGVALARTGRPAEAAACFRRAQMLGVTDPAAENFMKSWAKK
jgi:tetratricopeptide (TPR) repeat protein